MTTVEHEATTAPAKMTLPTLTAMVVGSMVGLSSSFVQLMIVVVLFAEDALNFMLDLCTSLALVPYLLSAAYAFKLAVTKETYENDPSRTRELIVGVVAVVYTLFLVVAAGPEFLLLSCIIYAPGTVLYVIARRENSLRVFRLWGLALCGVIVAGAIIGVMALATGAITI